MSELDAATLRAVEELLQDANRLCDRNLGGTYEEDCRRSIAKVRAALAEAARAEVQALQGAARADEARWQAAAARAGVVYVGCDTADALADQVQAERQLAIAIVERLLAEYDYDADNNTNFGYTLALDTVLDRLRTAQKADQ